MTSRDYEVTPLPLLSHLKQSSFEINTNFISFYINQATIPITTSTHTNASIY